MSALLTFFGHSAFQVETAGKKILIDPFLSENPTAAVRVDDVEADFIIVSHGHGNHIITQATRHSSLTCRSRGTKA